MDYWLTDEEADEAEMLDLFTEAREQVNEKYPRKKKRWEFLSNLCTTDAALRRWTTGHSLWFDLQERMGGGW